MKGSEKEIPGLAGGGWLALQDQIVWRNNTDNANCFHLINIKH
ncbi:hypothetical protein [Thauera chlorobenzoica]|nr:hypothetical protein [Thauera chlorobenzoica]